MTRTRTRTVLRTRTAMSVRHRLALTSALGLSLGVFAAPAAAQVPVDYGSFGTVTTTATNDVVTTPIAVQAAQPVLVLNETSAAAGQAGRLDVDLSGRNNVIEWSTFNVLAGKTISFNNALNSGTAAKAVLNRVTSATATEISGSVLTGTRTATGVTQGADNIQVWIVNGSGIMVGANANINTGGLVLSGLGIDAANTEAFRATAATAPYAVTFHNAANSTAAISGGGAAAQINTSNGVLALIAPQIDLTVNANADGTSGTGPTVFAIATDVSLTTSPGGPLSITLNAGTTVASDQNIAGAIVGDRIYALLKPADGVNALLAVDATISNATVDARGVVVLSGGNQSSMVAIDATRSDMLSTGTADATGTSGAARVGAITFATGTTTPDTGTVTLAATGALNGSSVATRDSIAIGGTGDATFTGTLTAGLGNLTIDRTGAVSLGAIAVGGNATLGQTVAPTSLTVTGTTSAANLIATAGAISFAGAISTSGQTSLTSAGAVQTGAITAGTDTAAGARTVAVQGKSIALGAVQAGTTASLTANGTGAGDNATIASIQAGGNVTVGAGTSAAASITGAVDAGGSYTVSGGSVVLGAGGATVTQQAVGGITATALTTTLSSLGTLTLASDTNGTGDIMALSGKTGIDFMPTGTGNANATLRSGSATAPSTIDFTTDQTDATFRIGNVRAALLTRNGGTTGLSRTGAIVTGDLMLSGNNTIATSDTLTSGAVSTGGTLYLTGDAGVAIGGQLTNIGTATGLVDISGFGGTGVSLAGSALNGSLGVNTALPAATTGVTVSSTATLSAASVLVVGNAIDLKDVTATAGNVSLSARGEALSVGGVSATGTAVLNKTGATGNLTINGTLSSALSTAQSETNLYVSAISGATGTGAGQNIHAQGSGGIAGIGGAGVTLSGTSVSQELTTLAGPIKIASVTGTVALSAVASGGSVTVTGDIGTTGTALTSATLRSSGGDVSVQNSFVSSVLDLTSTTGNVTGVTLDGSGSKSLTATAGSIGLTGGITGGGAVTLIGATTINPGTIGTAGTSVASLTAGGGGLLMLGTTYVTGAATLGSTTDALGSIVASGPILADSLATRTTGAQEFTGAITISGSTVLDAGSTVMLGSAADVSADTVTIVAATGITSGADITAVGAIDLQGALALTGAVALTATGATGTIALGAVTGAQALTVSAAGTKTFNGPVGTAGVQLTSLTSLGAGTTAFGAGVGSVNAGAQQYLAVSLGGDTAFNGNSATFGGIAGGGNSLSLDLTGATTLANVSGVTTLTSGSGGTTTLNGTISTSGSQIYEDAVILGGATIILGSSVAFNGALDGPFALTVNSAGVTIFNAVGQGAGGALESLTTDAVGSTRLGGNITTTGAQSFGDAVVLGADLTLTAGGTSGIMFGDAVNGNFSLTLVADGTKSFAANVGDVDALASLISSGNGATSFDTGATMIVAGDQAYGTVTLGNNDVTFLGNNATFGGAIVGNGSNRALNLSLNDSTVLNGVSGIGMLASSGGITTLNGTITTTGAQLYAGAVQLGSATTVDAGAADITFAGSLNGPAALTATSGGAIRFGLVGDSVALASLTTGGGGATFITADVTTSGAQTYGTAVKVDGGASTLTSIGGGAVSFNGALDGVMVDAQGLTIVTTGVTSFAAGTGTNVRLDALSTTGPTSVAGTVNAGTISFTGAVGTAGGTVTLAGGAGGVMLGSFDGTDARVVTSGGALDIGALTGAGSVSLTAAGKPITVGVLGAVGNALGELTITAGGNVTLGTTGATSYLNGATIGSSATPVDSLTLAGTTIHAGSFTSTSTGATLLGNLVTSNAALSVTSTGGNISGGALNGFGNKTLVATGAGSSISLTGGITGLGSVTLIGAADGTIAPGDIGQAGAGVLSLTVNGGALTLGTTYVGLGGASLGQAGTALGSIVANGALVSGGKLTAYTSGAQSWASTITTGAQTRLESLGAVTTSGLVTTGTDGGAVDKSATLYSGSGNLTVASVDAGSDVLLSARYAGTATISGDVTARGGSYGANGADGLSLTGGTHRATGAVSLTSGAGITLASAVSVTSDTDTMDGGLLTVGGTATTTLALTGSTVKAGGDGNGEIRFVTATDTSSFALGKLIAGTLSQRIGAGGVTGGIDRAGAISTNDLTLSGTNSIASDATLIVTGAVATGGALTLQGDGGVTVTGPVTNIAGNTGSVTATSQNGSVSLAGVTLGGVLSVNAGMAALSSTTLSAAAVTTTAGSIAYGDVVATTGNVSLTTTAGALSVGSVTADAGTASLTKVGGTTADLTIAGTLRSTGSSAQSDTNIYANAIAGPTAGVGVQAAGLITGTGTNSAGVALSGTGGTQQLRAGTGIAISGSTGTIAVDAQTTTGNIAVNGALASAATRAGAVSLLATAGNVTTQSVFTTGAQTLSGAMLTTASLSSTGAAGTITLTGDTVNVAVVTTANAAADIVANRRGTSAAGTSFAAVSLTSAHDVRIGQASPFGSVALTGPSGAANDFLVGATGSVGLGNVDAGGALDVATTGSPLTFATLGGAGTKTLTSGGDITGTTITGTGAVAINPGAAGAVTIGDIGTTGVRVDSLSVSRGGTVQLGRVFATGDVALGQTTALGSLAIGNVTLGGDFTADTTGATTLASIFTSTAGQAVDVEAGGSIFLTNIEGAASKRLKAGTGIDGNAIFDAGAITLIGGGGIDFVQLGAPGRAATSLTVDTTGSVDLGSAGITSVVTNAVTIGATTSPSTLTLRGPFTAGSFDLHSASFIATDMLMATTGAIAAVATGGALSFATISGPLSTTLTASGAITGGTLSGAGTATLATTGNAAIMVDRLGTDAANRLGLLTINGSNGVTLGTAGTTAWLSAANIGLTAAQVATLTVNGTLDHSGAFTSVTPLTTTVQNVNSGGALSLTAGGITFGTLSGGAARTLSSTAGIMGTSLLGSGSVTMTAAVGSPLVISGALGSGTTRLGALTVNGGNAVTLGTAGATNFLSSAAIGQTTAPQTLTINGPVDYTTGFTATTAGATMFGASGLGTVTGVGALSLTASAINGGALSTSGAAGTITLTGDVVTVGALATTNAGADIVADRRTASTTTSFAATSVAAAHDVLIGQSTGFPAFGTITLSAPSTVAHNLTADATGAVQLNSVNVGLGGALDVETTGTSLTFATLSGPGSKTLKSGGSITGTAITGLAPVTLTQVTTGSVGSVGASAAPVTSLTLNGGAVTLGATYAAGAVTGTGLISLTANDLIDAGSLTIGSSGAQNYNATVTTAAQTALTSTGGLVTTTALVNAGTNPGAANRSLSIAGASVTTGLLQAGSTIDVTGNGTVANNRDVVVAGASAGNTITIRSGNAGATTVSGNVTAGLYYRASGGTLSLTGGTQQAAAAVELDAATTITASPGVTIITNSDNLGSDPMVIGGATTTGIVLTGSTLMGGANGQDSIRFVTATGASQFAIGNVVASTLSQTVGGTSGDINRPSAISFGNLTLSGINSVTSAATITTGAISVGAGTPALTLNGATGVTVSGAIANIGAATGGVTINSSGGDVSLQNATLAGALTVSGTGAGGVSDVSFTTLTGAGAKVLGVTGNITGTAIAGTGAVTLTGGTTGTTMVGTLGTDAANRLGMLTINGSSQTTLGTAGGTLFLTGASIGQTAGTPVAALTVNGATDYTGTLIATTSGTTMLGAVSGVGALSLTAASVQTAALSTSGATGTITLTGDTVGVGTVATIGTTADIVANRRTASTTTSFTATSLSTARDALIGQGLSFGTITLSAPSSITRNFTARATGAVQLNAVATGAALDAATTGNSLTFTTLSGAGTKTLASGGSVGGTSVTGAGAVAIAAGAAGAVTLTGDIGTAGGRVASVQVTRGGTVQLARVFAAGNVDFGQTAALGSLDTAELGIGGNLTADVTGVTGLGVDGVASTVTGAVRVGATTAPSMLMLRGPFTAGSFILKSTGATTTGVVTATTGNIAAQSTGGAITINGAIDGPGTLTVQAATGTIFNAAVGGTTAFASFASTGATTGRVTLNGGSLRTANGAGGTQSYGGLLTLGADTTLIGGTASFNGIQGNPGTGDHDLTLNFDRSVSLAGGNIVGVRNLTTDAAGTTVLGDALTTSGTQTYNDPVMAGGTVTLQSTGVGALGNIVFANTLDNGADLTVITPGTVRFGAVVGGITALNSLTTTGAAATEIQSNVTTQRNQAYSATTLNGAADVTLRSTLIGFGPSFAGLSGPRGLTVNADQLTINGNNGLALSQITKAAGGTARLSGQINTVGDQTYTSPVTLIGNTTLTGIKVFANTITGGGFDLTLITSGAQQLVNGVSGVRDLVTDAAGTLTLGGTISTTGMQNYGESAVTLSAATMLTAGGTINFAGSVNGAQTLTASATSTTFNQDVGTGTALTSLAVTGAAATAGTGTRVIQTSMSQTYNGGLLLGLNTQLVGSGTVLGGQIDGSAGTYDLRLTFSGANSLIANPLTRIGTLLVDGVGTTTLNGAVTTIGSQSWNPAITIAAPTTLTSTGNQAITLNVVAGSSALAVATGGATNLNGAVSGITALTTDAGGTTFINTATITTTTGLQSYGDTVLLVKDTTLSAGGTAAASGITFAGTVTGPKSLTLNSAGQTTFNAAVGGTTAGAIDATISPTSLASTGSGIVRINGGAITTNGAQSYTGVVQLGADTVLRGTMGTFTDGIVGNGFDLRLIFANPVAIGGSSGGFDDLTVDNAASLSGIIVANTQTYNGAVTLTGDTTLRSGSAGAGTGSIVFNSTVDGAKALTVTTAGTTSLRTVGGTTALTSVTINGTGPITLNGVGVTTTGAQLYAGATTLTANNLLTTNGGNIGFTGTVDGPFRLSLRTIPTGTPVAGTVSLGGAVTVDTLAIRANAATAASTANRVGTLAANVRSGGFTFTDAGALTIGTVDALAGVATNTGAATITAAGGRLTVANDVSGTGAALTGTGVTQNAGTTVNTNTGTALIDANDATVLLAGNLTTANTGTTAIVIRDASSVQLNTIQTGTGGTLALGQAAGDNLSLAVTQLAGSTITAGTLVGRIGGSATLTNAGNAIGTLGDFASTGLSLRTSAGLAVTGPVAAGTGDLSLRTDGGNLLLGGNLDTAGTATFTVAESISQSGGRLAANILTGSASGGVALTSANLVNNLAAFTVGNGLQLNNAQALTVTTDETITGNLDLAAVGLSFAGRTLGATGNATLAAGAGALTGQTVTAANVTGTGAAITIDTANAGTTPTGVLSLTAATDLSLRIGTAGQSIALTATGGTLTSTGALTAGSAGNTGTTTSIVTASGGATSIASAISNNGGVSITGGSVTLTTATATNGALAITSNAGALALGTGVAGTTAMLSATGTPAASGTLMVTGSLTAGTDATTSSTGATTIATITATSGALSVTGASARVTSATAGTTMLIRGTAGAVMLTTGDAGGAATLDAVGSTGTLDIANRLTAASATITAGGAATIKQLTTSGATAVNALSANVMQVDAGGALSLTTTNGALSLGTGSAGTTATLNATGTPAATGTLDVVTSLTSGAAASLSATGAINVASVESTGASVLIRGASVTVPFARSSTALTVQATGGDVALTTGATTGAGGDALVTATGNVTLGTLGTPASAIQGTATVNAGGTLTAIGVVATGAVSLTAGGALQLASLRGAGTSATGLSIDIGQATATGALALTATGGTLTLDTGTASGTATLMATGNIGIATSLTSGATAQLTSSAGAVRVPLLTATTGDIAISAATGVDGGGTARAKLTANGSDGDIAVVTGGQALLGPLGSTLTAAIRAGTIDVSTVSTGGLTLISTGNTTLGTGTVGTAQLMVGGDLGVGTLTASGGVAGTITGAATVESVSGSSVVLTAGTATIRNATANGGALALTTNAGKLTLDAGAAGTTATLQSAGTLAVTTSLIAGNGGAANGNVTTTSAGATTILSVQSRTGSIAITGASDAVTTAKAATTLLIRGTAGAVMLGTGDAGGAATLDAVGANGTLGVTSRLNAASATLTAGNAATVQQLTTTGATSLTAVTADVTKVDAGATVALTTSGGPLTLGTGTSGGAATLTAAGPLAITTSLTSAAGATTSSTGATTIGAITANGGALSITGASAAVGNATASTTLAIRGTAGAVTLGTGVAGGAATLDAVGAGSAIGVTSALTAATATLTAAGAATVNRVTTTTGALNVQAASAGITTADAKTTLGITTSAGALTLGTGTSGAAATLTAAGPLTVTTSLTSASTATTTSTGATTIGTIIANGGAATINGQSVQVASARGSTTLDVTAGGGTLTLGTGTAANGAATLKATGALTTTTGLTSTGAATITAGGAATLGTTTSSGGAVIVNAASIAAGQTAAATTLTFTSTGNLSLSGNSTTGTAATFDAGGTASLGQLIASGATSTISIKALDAAITGTQRAGTVAFINRAPATNTVKLGNGTSNGAGFALSSDEVNFVDAGQLTIDGGTGNVEFGALAFNANAGRTRVDVLATGRIDVMGTVSGAGAGRTFRLGGTMATTTDKAAVIRVVATTDAGGRLLFDTADLDLRGTRIGVGQAAGFLDPIGFGPGGTPLSAAAISSNYLANPNSSLYNATFGGSSYTGTAPLISAKSLTVRYTDYALFQNTGAPGISSGVALATSSNPSMPALTIIGGGSNNAFAIYGTLNGLGDTAAAVSGSSVIQVSGADLANTRVNGCLAGSGAGCLTAVVSQPLLNIFDSSRLAVFRAADDLALPFDPVVGTNNEALFSGFGLIDTPVTDTECTADTTSPACAQSREQGK